MADTFTDYERRAEAIMIEDSYSLSWNEKLAKLAAELKATDAMVEALKEARRYVASAASLNPPASIRDNDLRCLAKIDNALDLTAP